MVNFLKLKRAGAFVLIAQSMLTSLVAAPLSLSKEQAVARALQQNPALNAARTTIDRALGNRQQAGRWANPELSIDYATDQTFNDEGEYGYSIGFVQRFPVTNRLRLQKSIAQDKIELAAAEVANQVRLLTLEVEISVAAATALEAQIELRDERLQLNRKFAAFMESRVQTGEVSSVETNQVQIELYAVEQEKQELSNTLLLELAKLKQLIGANVAADLSLTHQFELPATQPQLASLTQESLMQHPEYRMKALLSRISDKRVSVVKAERWADIAVRVFFDKERSVDDPGGLGTDRFFGVGVSIPLPFLDRKDGAILASRAEQRQFKYELDRVGLEVRSEAHTQATLAVSLYQQARDYDQRLTQLVEKNLAEMKSAYGAGQINLVELFRSQEQGLRVQSAQLTKLHNFEQAMIRWKAATAKAQPVLQ